MEIINNIAFKDNKDYNKDNNKDNREFNKKTSIIIDTKDDSLEERIADLAKNNLIELEKDKNALSPDIKFGANNVPSYIMKEILKYELVEFLEKNLAEKTKFLFKVSVDEIMKWTKDELKQPLLKGIKSEFQVNTSKQIFKNLQSYMNDRGSSKIPIEHVKKHLNLTINASIELKTEAYLQVLKQITKNKKPENTLRGLKFFAILASTYVPAKPLLNCLLKYLFMELKYNKQDEIYCNHINFIFARLYKFSDKKRNKIPCDYEIRCIEELRSIIVPINFFSGYQIFIPVESYTTYKDMKYKIMTDLKMNNYRIPYYNFFEVCNRLNVIEERFIDDHTLFVDDLNEWEEERLKEPNIRFKLYLKVQLFFDYLQIDHDTISFLYYQAYYDILNNKHNLTEENIITLSSLILLKSYGCKYDLAYTKLSAQMEDIIPSNAISKLSKNEWIQKIFELYTQYGDVDKTEIKYIFLDYITSHSHLWKSHQFYVHYPPSKNFENPYNFENEVILAIGSVGISINNNELKEIVFFPYSKICSWGINKKMFVLLIGKQNSESVEKYYFESMQATIIQYLLDSYTRLKVGNTNINEIVSTTSNTYQKYNSVFHPDETEGGNTRKRTTTVCSRVSKFVNSNDN